MAIYKYDPGSAIFGYSGLKTFLETYKTGTIFEDATFTMQTETSTSSVLDIKSGTTGETIRVRSITGSDGSEITWLALYDSADTQKYSFTYGPSQSVNNYLHIHHAFLCKYGLIVRLEWYDSNHTANRVDKTAYAITVDIDGHYVVFALPSDLNNYNASSTISSFAVCSANSLKSTINVTPTQNVYYTALSPIQTVSEGNVFTEIPKAFFAYETQAVTQFTNIFCMTMGTVKFISNGVWYIADEESE